MNLLLQGLHVSDLQLGLTHLCLAGPDGSTELGHLLDPGIVLNLAFLESALLDLDLLVKESKLLVSTDELRSEDVSLADDSFKLLELSLALLLRLLDGAFELLHLGSLGFNDVHQAPQPARGLLLGLFELLVVCLHLLVVEVTSDQSAVLVADLLLQCRSLVEHNLELPPHLSDLFVGLHQVLRMKVPVHANSVIQVLLLVPLRLHIRNLLLELGERSSTSLQLLFASKILGIGLGELNAVLLALLLELKDALPEVLRVLLPPCYVLLHVHCLRLLPLDQINLLLRPLVCFDHVFVEDVPLSQEVLDLFAIDVPVAFQAVGLVLSKFHIGLQLIPLAFRIFSLFI
mmetsp:Transcript_57050/g.92397  ORF Transcript_57050/g.92397 Transcript_57050/m.92397 type:complete len:345 (-) Transcript_57050:1120-2154(-)